MKLIDVPHLGRKIRLGGRRRPDPNAVRLKLRDYLTVPAPPAAVDYSAKAMTAIQNVYENDTLGDCVIAGFYHLLGVATGNASGTPFIASNDQILQDYEKIGGYVPGQPDTDQGCDELTALQYWQTTGAADGSKLAGFVQVDPTNLVELQTALWLFGGLYYGFELPDAWISPFPSDNSFVWDVAGEPDPNNGHCTCSASYNGTSFGLSTWGFYGTITALAIAKYGDASAGGDVFVILTPDWIAQGQQLSPSGVNWSALQSDLAALAPPSTIPPSASAVAAVVSAFPAKAS